LPWITFIWIRWFCQKWERRSNSEHSCSHPNMRTPNDRFTSEDFMAPTEVCHFTSETCSPSLINQLVGLLQRERQSRWMRGVFAHGESVPEGQDHASRKVGSRDDHLTLPGVNTASVNAYNNPALLIFQKVSSLKLASETKKSIRLFLPVLKM